MLKLAALLSFIWALSLLYGEMFSFWVPFFSCSWPRLPSSTTDGVDHQRDYVKIAVLTDPQLMDRTSLRLAPKSLALEAAQFYTDLYMRRAFLSSILPSKPDIILFLGDYFDGGPFLSDEEWQESWSRFKHIFDLEMLEQTTNIKLYYLAGNHDIGYAAFHSHMPEVIKRYEKAFGARNYQFTAGKVDFIAIDAQTLDDSQQDILSPGHPQNNETPATWNFVKNVSKHPSLNPRVLLTHISLYRPDLTACGPYRSSSIINQRINRAAFDNEILYQNYITENGTNDLLDSIKPALILSGHDHDQCTVIHKSKYGSVKEHTLGTISWQQGNLFPSYMLLSASNLVLPDGSMPEEAISTKVCFLPVQTYIYIWYLFLFVMTLLIAVLWPTNGMLFPHYLDGFLRNIRSLISSSFSGGEKKLKNEDEIYEYEEIWDAEGSMHLIKKTFKVSSTHSGKSASVERGNAVMRSVTKKPNAQETDASNPADVTLHIGSDGVIKALPRTNKSKTKMVIRRLVRTLSILSIVAAFNIPLYMMLLFKDWIDK
ncbi:hypothetical protein RND71_004575 [Anisodus tanguticus]|uniref:Calcineurin-like phosphoesterase domain-containing protein n=1 Tax=Anisodus tanguticus TaxID=243964 RepID=A0AAE1VKR2_9SOLA|nr:hypothetical protein RND71_004575 [Anisodus tanguticus]